MTDLRAYVLDETQEVDPPGRRCTPPASCLEPAGFLYDRKLASFHDDPSPRPAWPLGELAFARFDAMAVREERRAVCFASAMSRDADLVAWLDGAPFELAGTVQRAGLEIPDGDRAEAERLVVRVVRDRCFQPTEPRG